MKPHYFAIIKNKAARIAVKAAPVRMYTQKGKDAAAYFFSGGFFRFFAFEGAFVVE